jgi:hypothetical protein
VEYTRQRTCFGCHHQGMAAIALTAARDHGFKIDESALKLQATRAHDDLAAAREQYRAGQGQGGGATRAGYSLWTLELCGQKPDDTTEAVGTYLLAASKDRGFWPSSSNRPPTESSVFTSTYVSLRGLRFFGTESQRAGVDDRTARVREWLATAPTKETEDRVFRLRSMKLAGSPADQIRAAADELLKAQNTDGGWAQQTGDTDAYATGTVLVALAESGGVPVTGAAYRRGLAYLLAQQQPDGTWHVASRSKPFQPYFESGFPYGKDQFISMSATCWSLDALALASGK